MNCWRGYAVYNERILFCKRQCPAGRNGYHRRAACTQNVTAFGGVEITVADKSRRRHCVSVTANRELVAVCKVADCYGTAADIDVNAVACRRGDCLSVGSCHSFISCRVKRYCPARQGRCAGICNRND